MGACRLMDAELQQRAVEYIGLEQRPEVAKRNVIGMPPWEKRKSLLLRRMAEREVSMPADKLTHRAQRATVHAGGGFLWRANRATACLLCSSGTKYVTSYVEAFG